MEQKKEKGLRIRSCLTGAIWLALVFSTVISALLFAFLNHFFNLPGSIPVLGWLLIFNTLIAGLITSFINAKLLEPITRLSKAMKEVSRGDFEQHLETNSRIAEVGESYQSFNVTHVPSATLILALVIPLYNIQGVVLMTVKERQGRFRLSTVLLNVLKNPMILAVLAAIPFAYFKIQLPFVVSESLGYFQAATNTMALLVVGGSIRLSALKNDLPLLMRLCGVKLLLMPAIWAAMGIAAGLPAEQLVTLIIVGAMPAAVNVYIITDKMGGDGALACSAVVVTHLMSLFTMTAIIFAMRTARLI